MINIGLLFYFISLKCLHIVIYEGPKLYMAIKLKFVLKKIYYISYKLD